MDETAQAVDAAPRRIRTGARLAADRAAGALRTVPFTVSIVATMLVAGALTGFLWSSSAAGSSFGQSLSYGVPALTEGRPWAFLTGALLVPQPALYAVVIALIGVGVGFYERRVGAGRAAVALVGTQLAGTLGTSLLLAVAGSAAWPWAEGVAGQLNVGLSAGGIGVLAAATALMRPDWGRRVRYVVGGYLAVMLVGSGLLWDLEHLLAFGTGIAAGPILAGSARGTRRAVAGPRLPRARAGIATLLVLVTAGRVVEVFYPGYGGIVGPGPDAAHLGPDFLPAVGLLLAAAVVADALRRGRAAAWWVATVGSGAMLLGSAFTGQVGQVVLWAAVGGLLVGFHRAWSLQLPAESTRTLLKRVAMVGGALAAAAYLEFWMLDSQVADVLSTGASLDVLQWIAGFVLAGLIVPWLYANPRANPGPADAAPGTEMRDALREHGGGSLGWQRTWAGFSTWTSNHSEVAIAYRLETGVLIALGDPVGPRESWAEAVSEFRAFCRDSGWTLTWYAATAAFVEATGDDWNTTQIGEDTVLDLAGLEFRGKSWQDVRTARNRAERDGIRLEAVRLNDATAAMRAQLTAISREWVDAKPLPEMGFTLGTVEHALDPELRTHVAIDADGTVHGVTTWLPIHRDGRVVGWTLDVMRRRNDGFRPVVEFLIAESALLFKAEGFETMSLSVAPLARRTASSGRRSGLDRTLDVLSKLLEPAYGFRSLLDFKAKFHPRFEPVYLAFASETDLPEIGLAIGHAYLPHLKPAEAFNLVRHTLAARRNRKPVPVAVPRDNHANPQWNHPAGRSRRTPYRLTTDIPRPMETRDMLSKKIAATVAISALVTGIPAPAAASAQAPGHGHSKLQADQRDLRLHGGPGSAAGPGRESEL